MPMTFCAPLFRYFFCPATDKHYVIVITGYLQFSLEQNVIPVT
jgi:hypothetical protein